VKRTVLVTQRLIRDEKFGEEREALDVRWAALLNEAGLIAIPVPSRGDIDAFLERIEDVAGLVLTGGNDLSRVNDDPLSKYRDDFEGDLCTKMESRKVPILGVCRGLQFLASRKGFSLRNVEGHAGTRHLLQLQSSSYRFREFEGVEVNSYHHYGIEGENDSLQVTACAQDGTIEAFEHKELAVLGIMWHPERLTPPRDGDLELLRRSFVQDV